MTTRARTAGDAVAGEAIAARRAKLLEAATEAGCEAVVVYSPARHSMLAMDGVVWTTGYRPMAESAVVLVPGGGFHLFVTPDWDLPRAAELLGDLSQAGDSARAVEGDLFEAVEQWLDGTGSAGAPLLFCGERGLVARRRPQAQAALGSWLGGDRLLGELARRRDNLELELARRAAEVAEAAYQRLLADLRPGLDEYEAIALLESHLRALGSQDNFILVSASQRNRSVHPPTDRTIESGDVLLAEVSPSIDGMFTQICRSVTIGPPSSQVVQGYELLMASLEAGLHACRPGTAVAEVVAAMDGVIAGAGYGEYCKPPFMRARGHGLGIGSVLPGDISRSSTQTLVEGDYFVIHPNQYLPESGYLLCGEPIVIDAEGPRLLSSALGGLASVEP